jgi:membrane peptidoglycan carboxypeptidase
VRFPGSLRLRTKPQGEQDSAYAPPTSKKQRWLKIARWTAKVVLAAALVLVAGVAILFGATPSAGRAQMLVQQQAREHGIGYPGAPVPVYFAQALVATEDHRFYSDPGVDPLAIARVAAYKAVGKQDQGGSTIAQQLAKMLFTGSQSGFKTELEQVTLAVKLNMSYSKAQILQMYSEVAYYGHGYYGLEQASCGYFGHQAADLTLVQAAMLAGAVNAPTYDDPLVYPVQARARLVHVLGRMQAVGYLSATEEQQALKAPLGLSATRGCS